MDAASEASIYVPPAPSSSRTQTCTVRAIKYLSVQSSMGGRLAHGCSRTVSSRGEDVETVCDARGLLHASSAADASLISPGLPQENKAPASSLGANGQLVVAVAGDAEEEEEVGDGRMDLELEDYPGSGANDRHSPWWGQRRN